MAVHRYQSRITPQRLREVLHYEPSTGVFTWLERLSPTGQVGAVAGSEHNGYVRIGLLGCRVMAHVLAWCHVTGAWPDGEVDHRDTDRANNRWINLRLADDATNAQNQRRAHSNNTVGHLGVRRNGNGFQARISLKGERRRCLGTRGTAEEAFALYVEAKRELHPGNTL